MVIASTRPANARRMAVNHRVVGRLAGPGVERARRDVERVGRAAGDAGNHVGRRLRLLGRLDLHDLDARLPKTDGPAEDLGMAHDQRPAPLVNDSLGPGADDDLRPDAGRIAHRHGNQRFQILHYSLHESPLCRNPKTDCTPLPPSSQRAIAENRRIPYAD